MIKDIKKAHFVGLKGAGMTALAQLMKARGVKITGSDTAESFFTDQILEKNKIVCFKGFHRENVPADADVVVYSTAYNLEENPELSEARSSQIKLLSYPEALGQMSKEKLGLAVCGTHGKTTTAALLAEVLRSAGFDPAAVIGGLVKQWRGSALCGKGPYFVLEADEYQNKLRYYSPFAVLLTSLDWDHPDFFPDFLSYQEVFADFLKRLPPFGFLVVWGDSSATLQVSRVCRTEVLRYGFLEDNEVIVRKIPSKVRENSSRSKFFSYRNACTQKFRVIYKGKDLGLFRIGLPGKHNLLNAGAVVAVSCKLNLDMRKVRKGLRNFQGIVRRLEYIGQYRGTILIDDYAHHPEEIKAALSAVRDLYPDRKITAIFHPHTYSRTQALLSDFSQSFEKADQVIVLDIYASAREKEGQISSRDLVAEINRITLSKAEYIPLLEDVIGYLKDKIGSDDLIISLGAGDVWKITHQLGRISRDEKTTGILKLKSG